MRRLKRNTEWERRHERSGNESRVGASAGRERKAQEQGFSRVESQGQRKGAVSLYGMGRFPVTLYKEQWLRILASASEIEAFIRENDSKLKTKE
jgi:hypothetical protein